MKERGKQRQLPEAYKNDGVFQRTFHFGGLDTSEVSSLGRLLLFREGGFVFIS
ncbi:hypothetical protein MUP79_01980 [Candidatus Bathyarchaeota archaeon]|nr:hypothetical protein [Candidatus Bathyarchaeota archaeon]